MFFYGFEGAKRCGIDTGSFFPRIDLVNNRFFKCCLMVLRVGNDRNMIGEDFPPRVWPSSSSRRSKNPKVSSKKYFFWNFWQRSLKIIEFDLFDGLESCASEFRANSTKNHIFRPPGCRDWAQTLLRSNKKMSESTAKYTLTCQT